MYSEAYVIRLKGQLLTCNCAADSSCRKPRKCFVNARKLSYFNCKPTDITPFFEGREELEFTFRQVCHLNKGRYLCKREFYIRS